MTTAPLVQREQCLSEILDLTKQMCRSGSSSAPGCGDSRQNPAPGYKCFCGQYRVFWASKDLWRRGSFRAIAQCLEYGAGLGLSGWPCVLTVARYPSFCSRTWWLGLSLRASVMSRMYVDHPWSFHCSLCTLSSTV